MQLVAVSPKLPLRVSSQCDVTLMALSLSADRPIGRHKGESQARECRPYRPLDIR